MISNRALIGLATVLALTTLFSAPATTFAQQTRVMTGVRFDGDSITSPSIVSKVIEGGPADKAGLKIGDEILSLGDDFVVQAMDVMVLLRDKKPGDKIRLEIRRGERVFFTELELINHVSGDKIIQKDGKAVAAPPMPAVQGLLAPELRVKQWANWSQEEPPNIRKMKDKVVCLLLFQTTCQNSIKYGIPQYKAVYDKYQADSDIEMLAIQTPFFEYEENTHENAIKLMKEKGFEIPLGQDGDELERSVTRDTYKSPGTPWMIIIDKNNVVQFNDFDLPIEKATELIDRLKKGDESTDSAAAENAKPAEESTESEGSVPHK